jgi:transcriptional regulator with XRE-family HTH domain
VINKKKSKLLTVVGDNIREQRKAQGLTQQQLAFECGLELSQINRIELGKINTSVVQIARICKVLEINPSVIFSFDIDDIEIESD